MVPRGSCHPSFDIALQNPILVAFPSACGSWGALGSWLQWLELGRRRLGRLGSLGANHGRDAAQLQGTWADLLVVPGNLCPSGAERNQERKDPPCSASCSQTLSKLSWSMHLNLPYLFSCRFAKSFAQSWQQVIFRVRAVLLICASSSIPSSQKVSSLMTLNHQQIKSVRMHRVNPSVWETSLCVPTCVICVLRRRIALVLSGFCLVKTSALSRCHRHLACQALRLVTFCNVVQASEIRKGQDTWIWHQCLVSVSVCLSVYLSIYL